MSGGPSVRHRKWLGWAAWAWLRTRPCLDCEPGIPTQAEIAAPSGPLVAELLVVPDGTRMMAFGFIR